MGVPGGGGEIITKTMHSLIVPTCGASEQFFVLHQERGDAVVPWVSRELRAAT